jgi:hypothetical protein
LSKGKDEDINEFRKLKLRRPLPLPQNTQDNQIAHLTKHVTLKTHHSTSEGNNEHIISNQTRTLVQVIRLPNISSTIVKGPSLNIPKMGALVTVEKKK